MRPHLPLFVCAAFWLTACTSYHAIQVRVVSQRGGGIANAMVRIGGNPNGDGDGALKGASVWMTDAAGRTYVQLSQSGGRDWHISAEGFLPLHVDASADEVRIRQYGRRGGNHDAEPVVFVLEPSPPNAASDPKQFESNVDKKTKASEPQEVNPKQVEGPRKFES